MAQLIVRNLDDGVKERLRARAKRNGRSLEAEARAILEHAAGGESEQLGRRRKKGFGTLMRERFKNTGFTDEEYTEFRRHIAKLRAEPLKLVEFDK